MINRSQFDYGLSCVIIASLFLLLSIGMVNSAEEQEITTEVDTETIADDGPTVIVKIAEPEPEPDFTERDCLALNIYHESRGDSFAGRVAVADVVMNRVEHDRYPNTICEVVKQSVWIENWKGNIVPKRNMCQFSWFCDGVSDEPGNDEAWEEATTIADDVIDNSTWRGVTEGATHYHAVYVKPNWIYDRGMRHVGQIGSHEFYKWN
jgi:spore germination cell wall hydrolase CwlJ-like protein